MEMINLVNLDFIISAEKKYFCQEKKSIRSTEKLIG